MSLHTPMQGGGGSWVDEVVTLDEGIEGTNNAGNVAASGEESGQSLCWWVVEVARGGRRVVYLETGDMREGDLETGGSRYVPHIRCI